MCKMKPPNRLCVSHGEHIANDTVSNNQLVEEQVVRAVTQDMPYRKHCLLATGNFVGLQGPVHRQAVLESSCQGLLTHYVYLSKSSQCYYHLAVPFGVVIDVSEFPQCLVRRSKKLTHMSSRTQTNAASTPGGTFFSPTSIRLRRCVS
jgi:hypothetical protein